MALLAVCGAAWANLPAGGTAAMDAYLRQTQSLGVTDHAQFVQRLAELNAHAASLSPAQQWRLRYANAWGAMFVGDYGKSEPLFRDIMAHSGDPDLAGRSSALLMSQFGIARRYQDAFEMANRVVAELPQVADPATRRSMLQNLAQTLGLAGQSQLAIRYARMAVSLGGGDRAQCFSIVALADALDNGRQLQLDSPVLRQALVACPAATQPVYHAEVQLLMAKLEMGRGYPRQALTVLDDVAPLVKAAHYAPHQLSLTVHRAQALFALGDDATAMTLAQSVLAQAKPGAFDNWLRDAYELAYKIAKQRGDTATALADYERFAALDKAYLDDVNARAMAYETVQQHVLAQKLETEKLDRQNAMLRAQRALAEKTTEATRLYVALLAMALVFGALWMVRLKRSQLRFKHMSRMDGLTNILNRQHFVDEAKRALRQLEARRAMACMVFLDLDHFKRINDQYGHAAGDEVLRFVVEAARAQLRAVDLFGRLGGEEFGILLVGCTREHAADVADRIRRAVECASVDYDGTAIAVSTSVGLAFTDTCGYQLQVLFREADMALYKAKRGGRNRVFIEAVDTGLSGL